MPFVIKRFDGKYIKGQRFTFEWVDRIDDARVYPKKHNATLSLNHMKCPDAQVIPVEIIEKD